jgi:hypothetical protein
MVSRRSNGVFGTYLPLFCGVGNVLFCFVGDQKEVPDLGTKLLWCTWGSNFPAQLSLRTKAYPEHMLML